VYGQPTSNGDPVGCGLLGCLGGVILGLFGGAGLLVFITLNTATNASVPDVPPTFPNSPDLLITLDENFLNRFAEQPAAGSATVDILPGNQVLVMANTTVEAFGLLVPVQITGRFELQLSGQTLQVNLLDTQVLGIDFQLSNVFEGDVALINQNLQVMVDEISATLGVPITFTHLQTTDTQIQVGVRELQ